MNFNRFYDYILDSRYTVQDMNIMVNIALDQCLEGMKFHKKPTVVIQRFKRVYKEDFSWKRI